MFIHYIVYYFTQDVERLKNIAEPALHGKGLNVVLDPNLKKAWQVDGIKISGLSPKNVLHTTLAELCAKTLINLKLGWLFENGDSNTIEACIDKLVLHEPGGHYKRHHLSELEQGNILERICVIVL